MKTKQMATGLPLYFTWAPWTQHEVYNDRSKSKQTEYREEREKLFLNKLNTPYKNKTNCPQGL